MKKFLVFIALATFSVLLTTGFQGAADGDITTEVKQQSIDALNQTATEMEALREAAANNDRTLTLRSFHAARRAYKSAEFILEYFHHSAIKTFINGAPLPQVEQKVADINIIEPQGFQRIEELIYEDEPDYKEVKRLATSFLNQLEPIRQHQANAKIYDRHVIEAIRFELVRLFTLGITGFENPASDSSLAETYYAFAGMQNAMEYYAALSGDKFGSEVPGEFARGKQQLKNADFDSFDRLHFLNTVINPMYQISLDVHHELGIETFEEVNRLTEPTTYQARNLFDEKILNKDYFFQAPISKVSPAKVELGRMLFFDPALSYNNSLACASCHQPEKAFSDGLPQSVSNAKGAFVDRNAPTLVNAVYSHHFFHDLRSDRLESQIESVMANEKEFNIKPYELSEKLKKSSEYLALFEDAFPGSKEAVKPQQITSALASYVQSLTSWNSPFDQHVKGTNPDLSESAKRGFNLFMGKATCATCHFPPTFAGLVPPFYDDSESEVLGVTATNDTLNLVLDSDKGRALNGKQTSKLDFYEASFKTPTIRNIEVTGPYFHNGAYPTLEEVMWFYNRGGGAGLGLNVPHQTLPADQLGLSQSEIDDVIAFMNSLTDYKSFLERPDHLPTFEGIPELQDRKPTTY